MFQLNHATSANLLIDVFHGVDDVSDGKSDGVELHVCSINVHDGRQIDGAAYCSRAVTNDRRYGFNANLHSPVNSITNTIITWGLITKTSYKMFL